MAVEAAPSTSAVVRLLTALLVLMAVLVLGLGGAFFWGLREYRRTRESPVLQNLDKAQAAIEDVTRRQEVLARELGAQAEQMEQQLKDLRQRRSRLEELQKGVGPKSDQMIRLSQLMADEMLVMMEQLARTQASLARSVRPLPAQRDAVRSEKRGQATFPAGRK